MNEEEIEKAIKEKFGMTEEEIEEALDYCNIFKSTPSIFAFQPLGKGIFGYLLAIFFAELYIVLFVGIAPVTKLTPSGFAIGTM